MFTFFTFLVTNLQFTSIESNFSEKAIYKICKNRAELIYKNQLDLQKWREMFKVFLNNVI